MLKSYNVKLKLNQNTVWFVSKPVITKINGFGLLV